MRRLYPGLSLYLFACDRRFPTIIGQINGAERKGRRENNREGRTQRGQCVGSGIVIVSTRYLDQPASRLGLPRHAGVKDLLFLFLHWNPIGKSAEAFVRSLARSLSFNLASLFYSFLSRSTLSVYTLLLVSFLRNDEFCGNTHPNELESRQ